MDQVNESEHREEIEQLKTKKMQQRNRGLTLVIVTAPCMLVLFLKILERQLPQEEGMKNRILQFFYDITPNISSLKELLISIKNNTMSSLLTRSNFFSVFLMIMFFLGWAYISAWIKSVERLDRLNREAEDEKIKKQLKNN
jgi:Tfp pilus assembly protein PilO